MKSLADIENALQAELTIWYGKQTRDIYQDYYLYYHPATAEHDGGIIILSENPPNQEYQLAMTERIDKGATIEQNMNKIRLSGILGRLPILS